MADDKQKTAEADDWQDVPDWTDVPAETQTAPATPAQRLRAAARDPGVGRAIVSQLLQGFFKGGSDEAGAGIESLRRGAPMPGAAWRETGESLQTQGDLYRAARNTEREVLRGAEENYPKTSFAANLLGDLASDLVAKGLGVPVESTAYNVLGGGLSGLMSSDAELTPEKATPRSTAAAAGGAALGAAGGYLLPKLGERLAKFTPAALRALRTWAENTAVAQGTRALLNGADSLARVKPPRAEAVLEAIDSGAILPFGTTKGAFQRLEKQAAEKGAVYGALLEELEKAGVKGPDADALARELAERGDELMSKTGADKAVPNVFLDEAANLQNLAREPAAVDAAVRVRQALHGVDVPPAAAPDPRLGLSQAEEIKRALQDKARYGELKDTPVNDARQEVASRLREAIEGSVEAAGKSAPPGSDLQSLAESFVPVKQSLGRTLEARGAAEKGAAAAAKRSKISLTDYLAGASGGLGLAALNNFARNRGTSAVASGSRALSRLAGAGARAAAANLEAVQAGGREVGALLGRAFAPNLAELLWPSEDEETQAALIEALQRQKGSP